MTRAGRGQTGWVQVRKFFLALLMMPVLAFASSTEPRLDKAPDRSGDRAALQNGAKIFVNYCLSCHSASSMQYGRLKDIGLTEDQIKDNLMFTADEIGGRMDISMKLDDAEVWFGAPPPDLALVARVRGSWSRSGSDWLYTYLRGFYRDSNRPSGWNNVVFENVGMPHVLWELQGEQVMGENSILKLAKPGRLKPEEYDAMVADLVGFLKYMSEPIGEFRRNLGIGVLFGLAVLFALSYALKKARAGKISTKS